MRATNTMVHKGYSAEVFLESAVQQVSVTQHDRTAELFNKTHKVEHKEKDYWAQTEYDNANNPICPHCGHIYDIQENEDWDLYEDGDKEIKCPICNLSYEVMVSVTYSYSTSEQDNEVWEDDK